MILKRTSAQKKEIKEYVVYKQIVYIKFFSIILLLRVQTSKERRYLSKKLKRKYGKIFKVRK